MKFDEKKYIISFITIFSPDFYQLARLAEQNNSFLCKIFDQFFTYTICIWWKESIFCQKKWYISNLKKIVFMSRHSRIVGTISSASDFSITVVQSSHVMSSALFTSWAAVSIYHLKTGLELARVPRVPGTPGIFGQ